MHYLRFARAFPALAPAIHPISEGFSSSRFNFRFARAFPALAPRFTLSLRASRQAALPSRFARAFPAVAPRFTLPLRASRQAALPSRFARAFPAVAPRFTLPTSLPSSIQPSPASDTHQHFGTKGPVKTTIRCLRDFSAEGRPATCSRLSLPWRIWSWRRDLNPRPPDYKSGALPAELRQPKTARTILTPDTRRRLP